MLKHIRKILCVLLSASFLLTAAACSSAPEESSEKEAGSYQFTDDVGRTIVLEKKPEKVAVLFSSFAEVWKLSGGEVSVTVGESVERGFADKNAVLVDDGAGKTINTELLVDAQPDFVICSGRYCRTGGSSRAFKQCGHSAACFHVDTFPEYLNMLKI